jgi:putative SOS response-associated peptidase YedK
MCGRYTLTDTDPKRLKLRFGVDGPLEFDERPRFNIAPTDAVLAVRTGDGDRRQFGRLRWGLVPGRWAERSGRPLINARAETVATQSAFAESFAQRRCLIPADGFYEWRREPTGKRPTWISRADHELFAFAGIWAGLPGGGGNGGGELHSCAIITCEPNDLVRPIHDRMPVILDREAEGRWIDPGADPGELLGLLRPAPAGRLSVREVGDAVSDVREDGPHLLEPPMKLF